jgi:ribosomal protein S18 acetylase RimI-like enzyme
VNSRSSNPRDVGFLEQMLFEAFFWNDTTERPAFEEFRKHEEFAKLLAGWGRPGDRAVVAEDQGTLIGAAWFRLWTPECHSYGFVDANTPELAVAITATHRRKTIGRALLEELIATARADGFAALSLSVSPLNPARHLYESLGFQKVGETGTSWTLRLALG